MNNTSNKSLIGMGLAGDNLVDNNFIPSGYGGGSPFVWILSSENVQPSGIIGIWYDNSTWVDTNIWYD